MKNIIKRIAALICVLVLCCGVPVCASTEKDITTAKALRFGSDGKLRIMHITDTHLSEENLADSVYLTAAACDREKPDVVVLTGDIAMSDTLEETFRKAGALMNVFEERNIPVAVTFGNHDSESGVISREDLMAYFNSFSCSISVDDGELLPWCGTYNVPVLASNSESVKFNLWVFDSGDYDEEEHYSNVSEKQVKWYIEKSKALEEKAGEKVYSLAFQHIIVPEVYDGLKEVKHKGAFIYERLYGEGRYYAFDPDTQNYGKFHETPCAGYYNHGQFDAMVQRGDVLAMFTGHDHTNAFGVKYKGIDIVNSLSTRYNGDAFSTQYGYRMITVDENNTSKYETKVVHWYDFFNGGTEDFGNAKLEAKIRFLGFWEKFAENISVFFVELFTGRTVRYPD